MEYAQFFPIVGSQFFLVPSSLHVPRLAPPRRIDPCQWICGHAPGAIGQLKAAQLTLLFPFRLADPILLICVILVVSRMDSQDFRSPHEIIRFWAQTQQQREHWSSKARGNELNCACEAAKQGCKQWISVM